MSNKSMNPFQYLDGYARILSGEEEALFAWMSINYLYDMFDVSKWVFLHCYFGRLFSIDSRPIFMRTFL
jgi:hypothetical protein